MAKTRPMFPGGNSIHYVLKSEALITGDYKKMRKLSKKYRANLDIGTLTPSELIVYKKLADKNSLQ